MNIKKILNENVRVKFDYYRDNSLWYSTTNGFQFPVPVRLLTSTQVLKANDKATAFEYFIKRYYNELNQKKE